jgi:capsular exopolysaccharide synthesis family protein
LSEQFRRLAAALNQLQQTRGAHTVMVGSAIEGEGKTVTAVNLAFTLSRANARRVLLIDADLRRPSVHNVLQLSNQTGLGAIFRDPDIRSLPIVHLSPTLSVLTAGPAMADPSSFLISDVLRQLLAESAQAFDWVVLDTSPVVLFPDATLLAAEVDTALLVVAARSTPYPMVRQAIEAIGRRRLLGIVLNRIGKNSQRASEQVSGTC